MKHRVKHWTYTQWKDKPNHRKWAIRKKLDIRIREIERTLKYLYEMRCLQPWTRDYLVDKWRELKLEAYKFPKHPKHRWHDAIPEGVTEEEFYKRVNSMKVYLKREVPWEIHVIRDYEYKNK